MLRFVLETAAQIAALALFLVALAIGAGYYSGVLI
jgi:hypothetical protein